MCSGYFRTDFFFYFFLRKIDFFSKPESPKSPHFTLLNSPSPFEPEICKWEKPDKARARNFCVWARPSMRNLRPDQALICKIHNFSRFWSRLTFMWKSLCLLLMGFSLLEYITPRRKLMFVHFPTNTGWCYKCKHHTW